ncbi:MAG: hypothetical protein KAT70_07500, partial [Thermoplasmata archaeon]|nr:hypothetical protein [Thermoplasmata archaeon]
MDKDALIMALLLIMAIAGVWLTILTYIILSKKRRSAEDLVAEMKRVMGDEKNKAKIMPLLNEMLEGQMPREKRAKVRTIKKKAKMIDVSDIADLLEELDSIVADADAAIKELSQPPSEFDEKALATAAAIEMVDSKDEASAAPSPDVPSS